MVMLIYTIITSIVRCYVAKYSKDRRVNAILQCLIQIMSKLAWMGEDGRASVVLYVQCSWAQHVEPIHLKIRIQCELTAFFFAVPVSLYQLNVLIFLKFHIRFSLILVSKKSDLWEYLVEWTIGINFIYFLSGAIPICMERFDKCKLCVRTKVTFCNCVFHSLSYMQNVLSLHSYQFNCKVTNPQPRS